MIILHTMKPPIYVRPLSDAERKTLEAGLRPQRMPSLYVVARSCLPAPMDKTPIRSPTILAAIRKPHAMPSTRSTRRASKRRCEEVLTARTPSIGPSRRGGGRGFAPDASQEPQGVRQAKQPVDDGDGRGGEF